MVQYRETPDAGYVIGAPRVTGARRAVWCGVARSGADAAVDVDVDMAGYVYVYVWGGLRGLSVIGGRVTNELFALEPLEEQMRRDGRREDL